MSEAGRVEKERLAFKEVDYGEMGWVLIREKEGTEGEGLLGDVLSSLWSVEFGGVCICDDTLESGYVRSNFPSYASLASFLLRPKNLNQNPFLYHPTKLLLHIHDQDHDRSFSLFPHPFKVPTSPIAKPGPTASQMPPSRNRGS